MVARALGVAVGMAILLSMLLYVREQWPSLVAVVRPPQPLYLVAALVLFFVAYGINIVCWHLIVSQRGIATAWRFNAQAWCASIVWKYVPGKVWQGASRWQAYHRNNISSKPFIEAFVLEQLLTLAAAIAITLAFSVAVAHQLAGTAVVGTLFAIACMVGAAMSLRKRQRESGILRSHSRRSPHLFLQMTGWFASQTAALMVLGAGLLMLYSGLFGEMKMALLAPFTAALAIGGLAGILAFFVPSGIGVREAALAWILADFIPGNQAVALALACRVWITCGEIVLALAAHWFDEAVVVDHAG